MPEIDKYVEGEKLAKMMLSKRISTKHIRTLAQKADQRDPNQLKVSIMSWAHDRRRDRYSIDYLLDILRRCHGNTEQFKEIMLIALMEHPYYRRFGSSSWR